VHSPVAMPRPAIDRPHSEPSAAPRRCDSPHQIVHSAYAGDGHRFSEWIKTQLGFKLRDQRGEVERAQAERGIEIVAAMQRAQFVRALAQ